MRTLPFYIERFNKLKTDKSKGSSAPHKPILLLAIIRGIERGEILYNRIYITPELVAGFKDLWHQLDVKPVFTPNFSLPFYHLKSEGFWHLKTIIGKEIILTSSNSIRSFAHLKEVIDYASFNEDLFQLLMDPQSRAVLQQTLLARYFPASPQLSGENRLVQQIITQILNEAPETYRRHAVSFDEEEVFVRGGVFKKEIPRIYNYTCCISGMRVIADQQVQMVDACHIVPFSESGDDTISNGISLCPNLHRAFDRGLITISHDYTVMIKPFSEAQASYSIIQFDGKPIHLPVDKKHFPSIANLRLHHERFGFE